jgi:hypothetical protein
VYTIGNTTPSASWKLNVNRNAGDIVGDRKTIVGGLLIEIFASETGETTRIIGRLGTTTGGSRTPAPKMRTDRSAGARIHPTSSGSSGNAAITGSDDASGGTASGVVRTSSPARHSILGRAPGSMPGSSASLNAATARTGTGGLKT